MEQQVIQVEPREGSGKGAAHKVRALGKIPGVLYGHKQDSLSFVVDPVELKKKVKASSMGRNTVFKVTGLGRDVIALLKDAQIDPVRREVIHIDFLEIRESDRIVIEVPVELVGKPAGVVAGGILQAVRRTISVECSPTNIPRLIQVDVSHLNMGQAIHVSDIRYPEGTKNGYPAGTNFAIATVQAPRAETLEPQITAPVEGAVEGAEEGAAGAAAAAPAAAEAEKKPERKPEKK